MSLQTAHSYSGYVLLGHCDLCLWSCKNNICGSSPSEDIRYDLVVVPTKLSYRIGDRYWFGECSFKPLPLINPLSAPQYNKSLFLTSLKSDLRFPSRAPSLVPKILPSDTSKTQERKNHHLLVTSNSKATRDWRILL